MTSPTATQIIDKQLHDEMLRRISTPKGRELVASLVRVGDDLQAAIDKLAYEYKYRCVVDDEMGPANASSALDLSASQENALLDAKKVLEDEWAPHDASGETVLRFC